MLLMIIQLHWSKCKEFRYSILKSLAFGWIFSSLYRTDMYTPAINYAYNSLVRNKLEGVSVLLKDICDETK